MGKYMITFILKLVWMLLNLYGFKMTWTVIWHLIGLESNSKLGFRAPRNLVALMAVCSFKLPCFCSIQITLAVS
jgi:hypothetical protein